MSFFDWLFGKSSKQAPKQDSIFSEFASSPKEIEKLNVAAELQKRNALRRKEREQRRETLFGVVRECISTNKLFEQGYKFKVLSIDSHGRQFIVLIDLSVASIQDKGPSGLLMIEERIARAALEKNISVQAVYWRYFAHSLASTTRRAASPSAQPEQAPQAVAPAQPQAAVTPAAHAAGAAAPAQPPAFPPAAAAPARPPATAAPAAPVPPAAAPSAFPSTQIMASAQEADEQFGADELLAFQRALARAKGQKEPDQVSLPAPPPPAADNNLLLTGYEDTEQAFDADDIATLSKTQYGRLE